MYWIVALLGYFVGSMATALVIYALSRLEQQEDKEVSLFNKSVLPYLSIDQLHWLKSDAQHRIKTHEEAGEDSIVEQYVNKQKQIVELAREELKRRCRVC